MPSDTQAPAPIRTKRWSAVLTTVMAIIACTVCVPLLFYNILAWRITTLATLPGGFFIESPLATLRFTRSLSRLRIISGDLAAISAVLLAFLLVVISMGILERASYPRKTPRPPRSLPVRIAAVIAYGSLAMLMLALIELCIDV